MVIGLVALSIIIGLLAYALSKDPKIQEIGKIMFWTGWLVFLLNGDKIVALVK